MAEITFDITEQIGILSEGGAGWRKEINLVSWNNNAPKYDIRDWNGDHSRMRKGITLTADEVVELREILNEIEI